MLMLQASNRQNRETLKMFPGRIGIRGLLSARGRLRRAGRN
jgi:hypothetical protein